MPRQQGFVARHHRLAGFQRGFDEVVGFVRAADELDDDVDVGVVRQVVPVFGQQLAGNIGVARASRIPHGNAADGIGNLRTRFQYIVVPVQGFEYPRSHGSEAGEAYL